MTSFSLSNEVDLKIYDKISQKIHGYDEKKRNTTIIAIDEKSISRIGQWPWSRLLVAKLVENILSAKPASLGLDILFAERDRTSPVEIQKFYKDMFEKDIFISNLPSKLNDHDKILANVIKTNNVVFPIVATNMKTTSACDIKTNIDYDGSFTNFLETNYFMCNTYILQNSVKNVGFINASLSHDGLLRKYSLAYIYHNKLVPSLSVSMLHSLDRTLNLTFEDTYLNQYTLNVLNRKIVSNESGEVLNYFYHPKQFHVISASDILSDNFDPKLISGKFVFLGATAVGLSDKYSILGEQIAPGIFAHASFIENFLSDQLVYSLSKLKYIFYALSFVCVLFLTFLIYIKRYLFASLIFFAKSSIAFLMSYIFYKHGLYLPIGFFITPLFISYVVMLLFLSFILTKREKELAFKLSHIRATITNSMMTMVESRDQETGHHIIRTREFAKMLAVYLHKNTEYRKILNQETIQAIYQATPLHDIGKVGIPDLVLKKPGKYDENDREIMNKHPQIGYNIVLNSLDESLKKDKFLQTTLNIIYTHHERWDGYGYPRGLEGENIPIEGRIVALVDVYDALTSKRCYKDAFSFEQSEQIILDGKGTHFDPIIVDAFMVLKDEFKQIVLKYQD